MGISVERRRADASLPGIAVAKSCVLRRKLIDQEPASCSRLSRKKPNDGF